MKGHTTYEEQTEYELWCDPEKGSVREAIAAQQINSGEQDDEAQECHAGCGGARGRRKARLETKAWPPVLVVAIKRMQRHRSTGRIVRDHTEVVAEKEMTLPNAEGDDTRYRLVSAVVHTGDTTGHYRAVEWAENGEMTVYDDEKVEGITSDRLRREEVTREIKSGAVLYIYEKQDAARSQQKPQAQATEREAARSNEKRTQQRTDEQASQAKKARAGEMKAKQEAKRQRAQNKKRRHQESKEAGAETSHRSGRQPPESSSPEGDGETVQDSPMRGPQTGVTGAEGEEDADCANKSTAGQDSSKGQPRPTTSAEVAREALTQYIEDFDIGAEGGGRWIAREAQGRLQSRHGLQENEHYTADWLRREAEELIALRRRTRTEAKSTAKGHAAEPGEGEAEVLLWPGDRVKIVLREKSRRMKRAEDRL